MENIILPTRIEFHPGETDRKVALSIEPLFPGYGLTIGTALRRVLLSSLEGGAVVAVKIKGVEHEFATMPYVKEDVVDIILNLKKLRFKIHTDEMVRVTIKVKGEKAVTGADIETTSDVDVASPEVHICTMTDKNAHLEMELMVKKGRGFVPTEVRDKEKLELGTIMIDSLFTPIRNVGMRVEDMRVGQQTNYNRVVLDFETDGTLTGQEAMVQTTKILIEQVEAISAAVTMGGTHTAAAPVEFAEVTEAVVDDQLEDAYVGNDTPAVPEVAIDEKDEKGEDEAEDEGDKKKRGRPRK